MPVFTIETPTGTKLDIEAADQNAAINGAKQWHAQNAQSSPSAPAANAGETVTDAYKGLGTGVVKGALGMGGMVGDITDLGAKGIKKASDYLSEAVGLPAYQPPATPGPVASALNEIPTSASLQKSLEAKTGPLYEPTTAPGHVAETIGSFIPSAVAASATGGGSLAGNITRYAVAPGLAVEGAGKATEGTSYKPYAEAAAGITAALINPARLVTPLPATAARQAAVDALAREGVTSLTAGQRTGNTSLRYLEDAASSAPGAGHGAATMEAEGRRQFTGAALRRAGTAGEATPEVLANNQRRLGQTFEDLSSRNTLVPDNQFITDVTDAVSRYRNVPDSQQRAIVQGYINDIIPHVNAGGMPGTEYQPMRSMLSTDAKSVAQSDPYLSRALGGIRDALDSAMMRSISPQDQAAWQAARREYGAQKVIEKAASRAGEATAEGQITPANLRNTVASENRGGYSRGEGPFNELARAGVNVMTPLPNSGTAQRTNAFHLLNAGLLGIPQAIAGRAVMSHPVQSYLANQLMTGALPTNSAARDLLIAKMLQHPANQPQ